MAEVAADAIPPSGLFAARPALIRALNEQLLLEHIRSTGPYSRADLARRVRAVQADRLAGPGEPGAGRA